MSSSYDDLQRFRDKTQTNNIPFQEIATPKARHTSSDWNMINQVLSGDQANTPFPATVNTSRAAPETVAAGMFTSGAAPARENNIPARPEAAVTRPAVQETAPVAPQRFVDTATAISEMPATDAPALLKMMADIPVVQAIPVSPAQALADLPPVANVPAENVPRLNPQPARAPVPPVPEAPDLPQAANYAAMFAPAAARHDDRTAVRELSLQSVLERIASCR